MQLWNGVVMYAPQAPEHYAIPGAENCIFRLMQTQGDTQAWNLYWLTQPDADFMISHRSTWFRYYKSLDSAQTEAFYKALDTVVVSRLTLATVVSQAPREAMRLLARAHLERTDFYHLYGGEEWRRTMLGRLFVATRRNESAVPQTCNAEIVWIDFLANRYPLKTAGGAGKSR
ncbi:MAG TPA: hypothetical protein VFW00_06810 [Rhodocyclaceae bacterium]|nr:hypothetical protein [Rhodocyclaceae bacterium]